MKRQNEWLEKIRWMHSEDAQFMLDEISRVPKEVKALKAEKRQSHIEFIRAELATVNDILANLSENDVMGRMSFEGGKTKLETELQQAEKKGA